MMLYNKALRGLAASVCLLFSINSFALNRYIERCSDITSAAAPPLANAMLVYEGVVCGGDALTSGFLHVNPVTGFTSIHLTGASALNLYEVYWYPSGTMGALSSGPYLLGQVVTDTSGGATSEKVRSITHVADIATGVRTNVVSLVPSILYPYHTGWFLIYSRGPYAYDTDGDGVIDSYNTAAGSALANPSIGSYVNGVQFVSTGLYP